MIYFYSYSCKLNNFNPCYLKVKVELNSDETVTHIELVDILVVKFRFYM